MIRVAWLWLLLSGPGLAQGLPDAGRPTISTGGLSPGVQAAFAVAVGACHAPDPALPLPGVTVAFALTRDGRLQGEVTLRRADPAPASDIAQAFQRARRAVIRCQGDGYDLPVAQYHIWRQVELTFAAPPVLR